MNSKEMTRLAIHALDEKKAENIQVIDISEVSVIADYFIIANGTNRNQNQALADAVEECLGRAGADLKQAEGYDAAIPFGFIPTIFVSARFPSAFPVIHIFLVKIISLLRHRIHIPIHRP